MDDADTAFRRRKRRSLNWMLGAYVAFAAGGALAGGLLMVAAQESPVAAVFLAPTIGGVVAISRAFHEGRFAERGSQGALAQSGPR